MSSERSKRYSKIPRARSSHQLTKLSRFPSADFADLAFSSWNCRLLTCSMALSMAPGLFSRMLRACRYLGDGNVGELIRQRSNAGDLAWHWRCHLPGCLTAAVRSGGAIAIRNAILTAQRAGANAESAIWADASAGIPGEQDSLF